MKKLFSLVLVGLLAFGAGTAQAKMQVLATTTMSADLARQVGGDAIDVKGLMGVGVDPHLYQASAGDVKALMNADVVLVHGLHLEGKMGDIFARLENQGKGVINLEKGLDKAQLLADEDHADLYDPHIWFDPSLWAQEARYLGGELARLDPDNADEYQARADAYAKTLEEKKAQWSQELSVIEPQARVLVTAHDAFRYFGRAFGFEVRGLQGVSTEAEASTADVSELAQFMAERKIKALFIESSVPPKNVQALQAAVKSQGFDVALGGELYSDSLGDADHGTDTYISTVQANIDAIVKALK